MTPSGQPLDISVHISPELRALRAGLALTCAEDVDASPANPAPGVAGGVGPAEAKGPPASEQERPVWRSSTVLLRRDGARPLAFRGMHLAGFARCTQISEPASVRFTQSLDLYLTDAEEIVAQVRLEGPEDGPVRPIHLAVPVADAEDLARRLDAYRPEAAFDAGSRASGADPFPHDRWAIALRSDFDRLRAPLRHGGCDPDHEDHP